jgi:hypothetical protein
MVHIVRINFLPLVDVYRFDSLGSMLIKSVLWMAVLNVPVGGNTPASYSEFPGSYLCQETGCCDRLIKLSHNRFRSHPLPVHYLLIIL